MAENHYEVRVDEIVLLSGEGKKLAYVSVVQEEKNVYTIEHTVVDASLQGQGIASELVKRALEEIRKRGGKVKATCSYAAHYLEKHKSEIDSSLFA